MTFIYYQLQLKSKQGIIIPCCYLILKTSTELEIVTVWEQWCASGRIYLWLDVKLSKIAQETSSLACSSSLPAFLSCSLVHSNYSFSSPQRTAWGQRNVAVVERWPVHRFKQESMYGLSPQKNGHCREVAGAQRFKQESMYGLSPQKVAIVERWPVHRGLNKSQCMDCSPQKVAIAERWPVHRGLNKSQCMDRSPPKKWP